MKENARKCIKCGSSPANDSSITLHRFPNPGSRNSRRCEVWAKFCFPEEPWSSPQFQAELYSKHRMLCNKHFMKTAFDGTGKRLSKFAEPVEDCEMIIMNSVLAVPDRFEPIPSSSTMSFEPLPGPSRMSLNFVETNDNFSKKCSESQDKEDEKSVKKGRVYMRMKNKLKKINRLQKTIKHLKNKSFLNVISNNEEVNKLLDSKISPTFALLLQGEIQNFRKKSRGRRWNTDAKIIALRLFKRSPTCYRLLRRMICLPAPSSLKSLLNNFKLNVGINSQIFSMLEKIVAQQNPSENEYILMFDEMSIKKNLFYNKKTDTIEGFQDHASQGRTSALATHALVFMIAGIRKKIKQPVAYYLSGGSVTADRLAVLIKEVLQHCFEAKLQIAATVCDLDGVNKRALNILGASESEPYIMYNNNEIVTLFDTPHLLKCFRNMFMKYDIKCPANITSNETPGVGIAKWSHIKDFFELDNANPNFVFAPCLKQEHLNPNTKQKMRVKLAAQVLSHSVAAGMYAKISQGQLSADAVTTANVVSNMDKLFDSVNACTPDLRRGKPMSTNLKANTPHLEIFHKMKFFFKNLEFVGCRRPPPSQSGWIWTLNGIERVWKNLTRKHKSIKSLQTRRLQQDPLENLFGCIRAHCGSNTNPTTGQFIAGLKTAVLSNLSHSNTGNCERDENQVMIENFKSLLTPATDVCNDPINPTFHVEIEDEIFNSLLPNFEEGTGEIQACAYVSGFIIKNNPNKCETCKKIFMAETQEVLHNFTNFKEYNDINKCLIYASKQFIYCIENAATIINTHLNNEAYNKRLKEYLKEKLTNLINFEFFDKCPEHKNFNISYVIHSIFHICVKRFCIIQNRKFAEETSISALKRKIDLLKGK